MITVVPRGVIARRHFGASAIGYALWLYGVVGRSARDVHALVSGWGRGDSRWRTLSRWLRAISARLLFPAVRACPGSWTGRQQAQRVARTLEAMAPSSSGDPEVRVFAGAALAA